MNDEKGTLKDRNYYSTNFFSLEREYSLSKKKESLVKLENLFSFYPRRLITNYANRYRSGRNDYININTEDLQSIFLENKQIFTLSICIKFVFLSEFENFIGQLSNNHIIFHQSDISEIFISKGIFKEKIAENKEYEPIIDLDGYCLFLETNSYLFVIHSKDENFIKTCCGEIVVVQKYFERCGLFLSSAFKLTSDISYFNTFNDRFNSKVFFFTIDTTNIPHKNALIRYSKDGCQYDSWQEIVSGYQHLTIGNIEHDTSCINTCHSQNCQDGSYTDIDAIVPLEDIENIKYCI